METGFRPRHQQPHHPAQHHRGVCRDLERRGNLQHGDVAGDRRQPVRLLLRRGERSGTIALRWTGGMRLCRRGGSRSPWDETPRRLSSLRCSPPPTPWRRARWRRSRSGYQDMGPALRQMQDDDMANPGMLFVQLGEHVERPPGVEQARRRQLLYPAAIEQTVVRRLPRCRAA